jgi:hypothetical protein
MTKNIALSKNSHPKIKHQPAETRQLQQSTPLASLLKEAAIRDLLGVMFANLLKQPT